MTPKHTKRCVNHDCAECKHNKRIVAAARQESVDLWKERATTAEAVRATARRNTEQLRREATDYMHAVSVLFVVQPDGDCLAERKPSKDEAAYRAFIYLNDQGKLLRAAIDRALAQKEE